MYTSSNNYRNKSHNKPNTVPTPKNNVSYISFLSEFEKYMITTEVYNEFNVKDDTLKTVDKMKAEQEKYSNKPPRDFNIIFIREFDKLFWCFYICLHDRETYFAVDNKHFQIEKKMKIDLIEQIRSNRGLLKEMKLKVNDVEGNLANDKKIDLASLHAFCLYNHINVMICCNYIYYHFHTDDDEPTSIIHMKTERDIKCEKNVSIGKINEVKDKYYYVENPSKPLKSVGSYKSDDLVNMCKLFNITYYDESHKNFTKPKLFALISDKMN